ncbi:hypothetical protein ACNKHS_10970 [Shigella flexneri]
MGATAGPFSQDVLPNGGISPANYRDYLALKSVLCIGGSWLVPADALEAGDWDCITKLAREKSGRRRETVKVKMPDLGSGIFVAFFCRV